MASKGAPRTIESECDAPQLGQIQSLVRAFGILDQLSGEEDGLILTDIANRVGLPRSTVHRMLTTMSSLGYVCFETGTNKWFVGRQALQIGANFTMTKSLARLARPMMQSLMMEANETVNISIPMGPEIQYVGQVRSTVQPKPDTSPGEKSPISTSAAGKAMMAQWSSGTLNKFFDQSKLARRTDQSITLPGSMTEELTRIKRRGYALDDEENRSGIRGVAAPIFNCNGFVRASVSISGPASQFSEERLHALGRLLNLGAQRITSDFGAILAK